NVLVGEVYVCSGQSNMEWPVSMTDNAQEAIAPSKDPMLHLLTIPEKASDTPLHEVTSPWQECSPGTVGRFSAVAYFFGRDLRRALQVPVGLIHSSWGGTVAEAWTSQPTLESNSELHSILDNHAKAMERYRAALKTYDDAMTQYNEAAAKAQVEGKEPPKPPVRPNYPDSPNRPSVLYNGMITPLQPYAIRGAIWYQGESNASRAVQYQTLFPTMIRNWRSDWGEGNFPF